MFTVLNMTEPKSEMKKEEKSVSRYQTACSNDDECHDFRLICHKIEKICICTSFYTWNNVTTECMLKSDDLKKWLIDQSVRGDKKGDENNVNKSNFPQAYAGIIAVVSLCIISMVLCFLAFCEFKKKEENDESKMPTTSRT
ncbi:uncharacterized protein LOC142331381 isoform X2 [Lycorma delicatula]|uniref:uncharacterized protein LOC142331381 isoform X2 n=1 Tax=Lycorma delicatula TaxID=130591 RepID=UPI003F51A470